MTKILEVIAVMALLVIMFIVAFQFIEQHLALQKLDDAMTMTYDECLQNPTTTLAQCKAMKNG